MGVIIGSITLLECDEPGCHNRSDGHADQALAVSRAIAKGWHRNGDTGHVECPGCFWRAERFHSVDGAVVAIDWMLAELIRLNPPGEAHYRTVARKPKDHE